MREMVPFHKPKKDIKQFDKSGEVVWICMNCKNMPEGDYGGKRKLEEYVDDIICTVKNVPSKLLREVNDLPPNLEFTFEALKDKREHIACRHIATRTSEHQKTDFPVGQQVSECCGSSRDFKWRNIDKCNASH